MINIYGCLPPTGLGIYVIYEGFRVFQQIVLILALYALVLWHKRKQNKRKYSFEF